MRHTRLSPCQEIKYGVLESWVLRGPSGAFSRIQYALVLRLFFLMQRIVLRILSTAMQTKIRLGSRVMLLRESSEEEEGYGPAAATLRRRADLRSVYFSSAIAPGPRDGSAMARKCAAKDDGETHTGSNARGPCLRAWRRGTVRVRHRQVPFASLGGPARLSLWELHTGRGWRLCVYTP